MNQTMNDIRWSPRRLADYVRTVDGQPIGPGANSALGASLATWNLYWISYPELENHTDLGSGEAPLFAAVDPVAPLAIATAAQFVGMTRVGDLATALAPADFVIEMRKRMIEHLALARFFSPGVWLDLMEHRASLYTPRTSVSASAQLGLTVQQDGTNGKISTNILPLARIFARRLH